MRNNIQFKMLCTSLLMAVCGLGAHAQGIINTIAGTGVAGFSGDAGPAISANFSSPSGVATDGRGTIYVADYYNHCVRMISSGFVYTVAGNGSMGYSGMGGPAVSAGMEYPNSVFTNLYGNDANFYVTDYFADCAYAVSGTTANISNICGHNSQGCSGDGGDGPSATMELPKQIWKDVAGNTYIADYGNNRIRKIDAATNIVTTLTGGTHGFSPDGTPAMSCSWGSITGVCVDALGNVFVSDGSNAVVRKIDHASGNVYTVAGTGFSGYSGDGGPARAAKLGSPASLFVNKSGNLFICDPSRNVIRVVNIYPSGSGIINTLAGNGTAGFSGDGGSAALAHLNQPSGVWEDLSSGAIYIADAGNNRIRSIVGSGYRSAQPGATTNTPSGEISIFPNPSNGSFTISGCAFGSNTLLDVFNMMGEKVHTEIINQQQATVNIDQPAGIYNVVLRSPGGVTTQKIVIEK